MKLSRLQVAMWIGTGLFAAAVVAYGAISVREIAAEADAAKPNRSLELGFTKSLCDMPKLPDEPPPGEYEDIKRGFVVLRWVDRADPKKK